MRTIIAILLFASAASAQTFGLGDDNAIDVSTSQRINDTFGLGDSHAVSAVVVASGNPTPKPSDSNASTVSVARSVPLIRIVSSKTVEAPYKSPIVRRARGSWTDGDVGPWTVTTLTMHLRGELESSQHRGRVPADQLDGRTLSELKAIHDNLHEGFSWNGSPKPSQKQQAVQFVPMTFQQNSTCPSGNCPQTTGRRGLFGWRR